METLTKKQRMISSAKRIAGTFMMVAALLFTAQSCNNDDDFNLAPDQTQAYRELNLAMRALWNDHMQYTFSTVDAFFHNENALGFHLNRLLQNQQDIGDAIKPYYGEAAGNALADLLTEHIELAVPVLTAAQNGDEAGLEVGLADWYQNAEEIGDFLAAANPFWAQSEMRDMMRMHIDQTTEYSVKLLQEDYHGAILIFEEANHHMRMMADELTEGIALQFPEKFL